MSFHTTWELYIMAFWIRWQSPPLELQLFGNIGLLNLQDLGEVTCCSNPDSLVLSYLKIRLHIGDYKGKFL